MVNAYHLCAFAALVASTATSVVATQHRYNAVHLEACRLSRPLEAAHCVLQARGNKATKPPVGTLPYHCHFTILERDCEFLYRHIY